jgi:hypothetical protein
MDAGYKIQVRHREGRPNANRDFDRNTNSCKITSRSKQLTDKQNKTTSQLLCNMVAEENLMNSNGL